jgi:hypothetical protein
MSCQVRPYDFHGIAGDAEAALIGGLLYVGI